MLAGKYEKYPNKKESEENTMGEVALEGKEDRIKEGGEKMKKVIKQSIAVIMCLLSLLLCCCGEQQQGKPEDNQPAREVTQEPITKGTWKGGVTYQYNVETATLTVSGKTIKGIDFSMEELEKIPWGRWRDDIRELILEEGVECVTDDAFRDFRNLKKIKFPGTLKKIGEYAFYESMRKIRKLELPDSVEEIGWGAFAQDSCYGGIEKIHLPKNLRSIGSIAFSSQPLNSVTIPENVESIGNEAFEGCSQLETVTVKSKKIKKAGGCVFLHTNEELEIYVPKELEKKYRRMLGGTNRQVYPMKDK